MNLKINLKIIFVMAPGVLAGAEKVVLTGLNALIENGETPSIIVIKETRAPHLADAFIKELPKGVIFHTVITEKAIDLKLPKRILEVINSHYNHMNLIVHSHGFKALIATSLSRFKKRHVHTHHGNTGHTLKVKFYEFLANLFMRKTHQVVAVSHKMQKDLKFSLFPFSKIAIIENMLSFNEAQSLRETHLAVTNELIHLIYIGRISPEKGLIEFIHAFKNISDPQLYVVTILGDGPTKKEAMNLTEKLGLSQFSFKGFVSNPGAYLVKADVLIMPSLTEGLPMTLIESLAVGVPVIANDVGAISELVQSNFNGKLIPFGKSIDSEYEWISYLNVLPSKLSTLRENAINDSKYIEEKYGQKNWATKTIALYENL